MTEIVLQYEEPDQQSTGDRDQRDCSHLTFIPRPASETDQGQKQGQRDDQLE